jgi:hypothetical protein
MHGRTVCLNVTWTALHFPNRVGFHMYFRLWNICRLSLYTSVYLPPYHCICDLCSNDASCQGGSSSLRFTCTYGNNYLIIGTRGSLVVKALCYKPEARWFETPWKEWFFINLPNSSFRGKPWGLLASNKNEYQRQKYNCLHGVQRGRRVMLTITPPSVSRLSTQSEVLNITRPDRLSGSVLRPILPVYFILISESMVLVVLAVLGQLIATKLAKNLSLLK